MLFINDLPKFKTTQWEEQKIHLEKYIKPLYCHPNIEGHKKIANFIIELLTDNHAQWS